MSRSIIVLMNSIGEDMGKLETQDDVLFCFCFLRESKTHRASHFKKSQ